MANIIEVEDLKKSFAGIQAVKGISFSSSKDHLRISGPKRGRQIDYHQNVDDIASANLGVHPYRWNDPTKDPHAVRRAIGVVFQDPSLDEDLTAWENMELHGVLYGVPRSIAPCAHWRASQIRRTRRPLVTVMCGNFLAA